MPHMNVYVEYVLLDNMAVDCLLLYLATATLHLKTKWYKLLLGSFIGGVCAIATVQLQGAWIYLAKMLSLFLMCVATVGFGKKLFWHILLTLAYTFVLGGAIIGIFNLSTNDFVSGVIYQSDIPLFVYAIALFLLIFLTVSVVAYFKNIKAVAPYLCKVVITLDKSYKVTALLDSGNCAQACGVPLCFVGKRFAKLFAQLTLQRKTQSVTVLTVAGQKQFICVKGFVTMDNATTQVFFAISQTQTLYDVILSNQLFGGKK